MGARRLGVGAAVSGGAIVGGDVELHDGRVTAIGVGRGAPGGRTATAGFVDLQVNGFAGVDFTTADEAGWAACLLAMACTGVTAALPTIPTAPAERYVPALATATAVQRSRSPGSRMLGVHLEGPFLAPARRGAHRADWL